MILCRLNIFKEEDIEDYNLPGYKLILDNLYFTTGRARTILFIADRIRYTRREELEVIGEPTIVITIHPLRAPPFNLYTHYRQWQKVAADGAIPNTGTPAAQKARYKQVVQKWKLSISERETIYNGDMNIDLDKNYDNIDNQTTMTTHEQKVVPIYKILRDEIFSEGASLIRTPPTKHNLNKKDSYLDHIITTEPRKIFEQTVHNKAFSDHYPITFKRRTKNGVNSPTYTFTRDFNIIDWKKMEDDLNRDERIMEAALSNSPRIYFSTTHPDVKLNTSTTRHLYDVYK